jgi:hypothetical protein
MLDQADRLRAALDDVRARLAHGYPVPGVLLDELVMVAGSVLDDLNLLDEPPEPPAIDAGIPPGI